MTFSAKEFCWRSAVPLLLLVRELLKAASGKKVQAGRLPAHMGWGPDPVPQG
jgi:hypothetical protein